MLYTVKCMPGSGMYVNFSHVDLYTIISIGVWLYSKVCSEFDSDGIQVQ